MPLAATLFAVTLLTQEKQFKIDDYSTEFGQAIMKSINDAPNKQDRAKELKPVTTGYFYWRMQTLGKLPSSKLEKLHMNVCATMLDFYHPGVAKEWEPFYKRIENDTSLELPADIKTWLNKDLRTRVFEPYWRFTSDLTPVNVTDKEMGEFLIGITLGDLSGNMVLQYMSNGMNIPREWMADNLESLGTNLKDYPTVFTPEIRARLDTIAKMKKGDAVDPADYPALEKVYKEALNSIAKGS